MFVCLSVCRRSWAPRTPPHPVFLSSSLEVNGGGPWTAASNDEARGGGPSNAALAASMGMKSDVQCVAPPARRPPAQPPVARPPWRTLAPSSQRLAARLGPMRPNNILGKLKSNIFGGEGRHCRPSGGGPIRTHVGPGSLFLAPAFLALFGLCLFSPPIPWAGVSSGSLARGKERGFAPSCSWQGGGSGFRPGFLSPRLGPGRGIPPKGG